MTSVLFVKEVVSNDEMKYIRITIGFLYPFWENKLKMKVNYGIYKKKTRE